MPDILHSLLKTKKEDPEQQLRERIVDLRREIDTARNAFEYQCDNDLIDANIFELNSLMAKYKYLIRLAKEKDSCGSVVQDKYA